MAIAISSSRADSASVLGVAFKLVLMVTPGLLGWDWYLNGFKWLPQAYWADRGIKMDLNG